MAAFELNHANKVLGIIMAVLDEASADPGLALQPLLSLLSDEQLQKLLEYLSDWNTNSKYAWPAQMVLSALLSLRSTESLLALPGLADKVPGLIAYSERHFQRVDRLHQAAFIVEYIVGQMSLLPAETLEVTAVSKRSSTRLQDEDEDAVDGRDLLTRIFGNKILDAVGVEDPEEDEEEEDHTTAASAAGAKIGNHKKARKNKSLGTKIASAPPASKKAKVKR